MPADTVWVVNSNIFVSNVAQITLPARVRLPNNNVLPSPKKDRLMQILHSNPVTPVKVERLDFLLNGFSPSLKQFFVNGFSCWYHKLADVLTSISYDFSSWSGLTLLKHNILFRTRHIPGVDNTDADYISHFQVDQFRQSHQEWTNCQPQFSSIFCRRVGPYTKSIVKFSVVSGYAKNVSVSKGCFQRFLPTILLFYISISILLKTHLPI